ncbi:MAG: cysteine--tRNA ligase [Oscillospiraceae bacterium]|nr:cysteine--tRNA ligase [Oscillospiraceae bacterium]
MVIYNTMSKQKEELTLQDDQLKIYVCGATVYDLIHIGNARTACVFDTLRRYLIFKGIPVTYVTNFTDVDDRIIDGARREGISADEYSKRYIEECLKDYKGLGIMTPDILPLATESIDMILSMIGQLVEKGFAYATESGDVYFKTADFKEYGKLSNQNIEELKEGVRVDLEENKLDPLDFALWKSAKPDEVSWDSPYGKGRPGWHIECSAMCKSFLGDTIDIHGGGLDLVFPHHENEIAQSECCNETVFARYWMHVAMLNIENRKMSKSLGNFFTVRELSDKYGYEALRFLVIGAHYRSQLNFTFKSLESCLTVLARLRNCRDNLIHSIEHNEGTEDTLLPLLEDRKQEFITRMDDDLNTADAIAVLFALSKDINSSLNQKKEVLEQALELFMSFCTVLGILQDDEKTEIPETILVLVEQRRQARINKDFAKADEIRKIIDEMGFVLEDTKDGSIVKAK